jgi:hypothetical protein
VSEPVQKASEDAAFGLDHAFVQTVVDALAAGDVAWAAALVNPLHPADIADLLQSLPSARRSSLPRGPMWWVSSPFWDWPRGCCFSAYPAGRARARPGVVLR